MNELKIEYVPIGSVKMYAKNAKLHPDEQVEQIKKSITDYGMRDPIGVWKNEIVEGHGRYLACTQLGYDTIPIIRLDDMTDKQRREYMLVHNKTNMNSGFDFALLDEELAELGDFDAAVYGFEIDVSLQEKVERKHVKFIENISVVIDCETEEDAERIFDQLQSEGYECRISTL